MTDTSFNREQVCAHALNLYLFQNVWNESVSEYRINLKPILLTQRPITGSLEVTDGTFYLPTTNEAYYVWVYGADELPIGLLFPSLEWIDTATITNKYRVQIDMYGVTGAMFPKGAVYYRFNSTRTLVYLAVKKSAVAKCRITPKSQGVYLTVYYDSDIPNDIKVASVYIADTTNINAYQSQLDAILSLRDSDDQVIMYKNGVEVTSLINPPALTQGSYIDYIVDRNIVFACDIDLTTSQENPTYRSTTDGIYKQLIHIPKGYNPNNEIFTYNTVDFYARRVEGTTPYGLYIHRAANRAVTQVTHNDYGIPLYILDAYRDYLDEQEISVHVVVRRHAKDNTLIEESNYLKLLYSDKHSDKDIVNFLVGKGDERITWWTADYLENTKYVRMMFDSPNGVIEHSNSLDEYIEVLGFYQVADILAKLIRTVTITDGFTGQLSFPYPILYSGNSVYPVVYINGVMISPSYLSHIVTDESVTIKFSDSLVINQGDRLTVIFHLSDTKITPYLFKVTGSHEIEVPFSNPVVYERVENTSRGVGGTYNYSYKKMDESGNAYATSATSTGTKIVFNSVYTDSFMLIENPLATRANTVYIDEQIETGDNVVIPLYTQTADGYLVPVIQASHIAVYYNGKYLVPNIDYVLHEVHDDLNQLAVREVVIQTMDHFTTDTTNRVDIVLTSESVVDQSASFEVNDELFDSTPINFQYFNTSLIHVDGLLETQTVNHGYYTSIPKGKYPTGAIWEIKTIISQVVTNFIELYSDYTTEMETRRAILQEYFTDDASSSGGNKSYPETIVLEKKHRIYSIFTNDLIQNLLSGNLNFAADPDLNRLSLAVSSYKYLQDIDLVNKGIDQRFVDFYPQYTNYEVPVEYKPIIDTLVARYLPDNVDATLYSVAEESKNAYAGE